jgi:hypothetical protein
MAREIKIKEIDGHRYRCDMMPIRLSHQTLISLCSTLGEPVVKAILSGMDDDDGDVVGLLMGAIVVAMRNLDGPVSDQLIESLFQGMQEVGDGKEDIGFPLVAWDDKFNDHFHGRPLTMYKVWVWSMQVNYKDFLDAAQALGVGKAKDLGTKALTSLLTPTSASGPSSSASGSQ